MGVILLERRWTTFSKWKFREFNELPHIFESRYVQKIVSYFE